MKNLLLGFIMSSVIIVGSEILDISRRSSASAITLFNTTQKEQGAPLTLSQLENLIKHQTPDSAIAIEIQQRGVDFRPNANQLARLKRLNAGPKTIQALQPIPNKPAKNQRIAQAQTDYSPNKVTILVADFDGPNSQNYRVTEKIIQQLRHATDKYFDISIEALRLPVTEQQGSEVARAIGKKRKADIVLWGWYGPTQEKVNTSFYFEVLRAPELLSLRKNFETRTSLISELNGFEIQTRLSGEMTYLTLLTIGLARYESRDYDEAIDRFTKALDQSYVPDQMINPADVYFYRGLAYHYKSRADKIDESLADCDCDKATETKPNDVKTNNNHAIAYKGEYDKSIADYDKVIKIKPDFAAAYNNRGNVYSDKGEYDKAIADYDKAIEIKPYYAKAYNNRGNVYAYKGEYDKAIGDYDKVIEIKPNDAEFYNGRGIAYYMKGEHDRAIADFDKVIEIRPDSAEAYYNRGNVYIKKKQYDSAIADYSKAIKFKPNDAKAHYNRGILYDYKGEYDKAIADYDKAIKIRPDFAAAYRKRGTLYSDKGEYDKAIANYDKAIQFRPDYAKAYYDRALIYHSKGDRDRSISDFKRFIQITNDSDLRQLAQKKLQELGVK
jgi:tetratricopeptide (TPR) repeat protein